MEFIDRLDKLRELAAEDHGAAMEEYYEALADAYPLLRAMVLDAWIDGKP